MLQKQLSKSLLGEEILKRQFSSSEGDGENAIVFTDRSDTIFTDRSDITFEDRP